jgi:hypothetical protein
LGGTQERLEREHNLSLIMSAPTVVYRCTRSNGDTEEVSNPSALPDASVRETIAEPFVKMDIITPSEYNGALMELCQFRRGVFAACLLLVCLCLFLWISAFLHLICMLLNIELQRETEEKARTSGHKTRCNRTYTTKSKAAQRSAKPN